MHQASHPISSYLRGRSALLKEREEAAPDLEGYHSTWQWPHKRLTLQSPVYGMPPTLPLTGVLTGIAPQAILQGRLQAGFHLLKLRSEQDSLVSDSMK